MVKVITRKQLIETYLRFFKSKGHKVIPSASLVPANDPTVLFTTAGMHPLVPYLLGQKHPSGKRLVSNQRCLRTTDIDAVGDATHHTFFEMLGNWSLGDYWKKEAIEFSYEFLTKNLGIKPKDLSVTCFAGDKDAPRDEESAKAWKSLGIKKIKFLGKKDNWWGPAGETGPCGPDTEMFVNNVEIWNDVFMQYNKTARTILVDGMGCIYDENFQLNKKLVEIIDKFNVKKILTVAGFRERGRETTKNHINDAFSLEEKGIKKDNPEYFRLLLSKFNLNPKEVIYFDHGEKSVKCAESLGIKSKLYKKAKDIEKFIENNLYYFEPLSQKNVDTGMGVERTLAILNGLDDNYMTEVWKPIIDEIEHLSGKSYKKYQKEMRVIADHIKASVFMIADGVLPGNTEREYVLRRLIRRAIIKLRGLGLVGDLVNPVADEIYKIYPDYKELQKNRNKIYEIIESEEDKFEKTLEQGLRKFNELSKDKRISGKDAFLLYQSYGFPIEITQDLAKEKKVKVDIKEFNKELQKHQQLSRTSTKGKFKSGLADHSEKTTRLHTATHLLNEALRQVLGKEVRQRGSNITPERLRFDFNFPRKLTDEEIKRVEALVNDKIKQGLVVARNEMKLKDALKSGAQSEFNARYPDVVSVYSIGNFSKEICTGPHVSNTKEIGTFKIVKEESSASGIRRIKAIVKD